MPQLNYSYPEEGARAGMLVDGRSGHKKFASYTYGQLADTYTVTVGGSAADGIYSFDVNGHTVSFDRQAAEANAAIAAALATAGEAHLQLMQVASFADDSVVVTVTALTAGQKLTVDNAVSPSGATLVIANTVDSDRADLDVGIIVASDDGLNCRPPASGDTAADLVGATWLAEYLLRPRTFDSLSSEEDGYPPGMTLPIAGDGDFADLWLHAEEALTMGSTPYVRLIATGTEKAGALRSDAGGSAGTAQIATVTPGAAQHSVPVAITITMIAGPHEGKSLTLQYVTDANMTATEVCDNFRTDLNADAFWSALLTDGGTDTLTLTADPEHEFDIVAAQGSFTIDLATQARVAPVPDAIQWDALTILETTTAAGLVKCRVRR